MNSLTLSAVKQAAGEVKLPGSKSISNRVLLLAALANGSTTIHDLLDSDDTKHMLTALRQLGVKVESIGENSYQIDGCNGDFTNQSAELFLGNAGTAFRPLTAALAFMQGNYELSGVARMYERPIAHLVDALRQLGAQIEYLEQDGYPPLKISPFQDNGRSEVTVCGNISSQFLTALLLAAPLLKRDITIKATGGLISKPYINITLEMLKRFNIFYHREDIGNNSAPHDAYIAFSLPDIKPPKHLSSISQQYNSPCAPKTNTNPLPIYIEGDASSASYFLAAGLLGGGPVTVSGVGKNSIQGDVKFADALAKLGAKIDYGDNFIRASSPDDYLWKERKKIIPFNIDANHIPDAAMTLAVLALAANGTCTLSNIASWRVKETDRIHAMAKELGKLGATVEEGEDYLKIKLLDKLKENVSIDTYDDHRMAMCFSLVSLMGVSITINNPECVSKTFPDYFEVFAQLTKVK